MHLYCTQMNEDWPDQLEGVVDEAGPVIAAERCVIVFEQLDEVIPARTLIVHNVISTHVHIKLDPVYLLRQIQNIYDDIHNRSVRNQCSSVQNNGCSFCLCVV